MRRLRSAVLVAGMLAVAPGPARTAEVTTIEFDLAGSIYNVSSPFVGSNPLSAGTLTLRFTDPVANSRVDASALVDMLSLFVSIDPNTIGIVYGSLRLTQTLPAYGGHVGSGGSILGAFAGSTPGRGSHNGAILCASTNTICHYFFGIPGWVAYPFQATNVPFGITVPNVGTNGTPLGPNPIALAGFGGGAPYGLTALRPFLLDIAEFSFLATGSFQLVGSEVGRTKVVTPAPEPGALALLLLGALGFAGGLAWTRRRG